MVTIAYGEGVVLFQRYYGNLNGCSFPEMILKHFFFIFHKGSDPRDKILLQDRCATQKICFS